MLAAAGLGRIHSALRSPTASTRKFSWSKWSWGTMSPRAEIGVAGVLDLHAVH